MSQHARNPFTRLSSLTLFSERNVSMKRNETHISRPLRRWFGAALALGLIMSVCTGAQAAVITHSGANDPVGEGWTKNAGANTSASALSPDGTTGKDAWQVVDNGTQSGEFHLYEFTLSATQLTAATNQGWELSATLRLPTSDQTTDEGVSFDFGFGGKTYRAMFGTTSGGDTQVSVKGDSDSDATLTGLGYHNYLFAFDPVTDQVSFSIDGVEQDAEVVGFTGGVDSRIRFGSLGSTETGTGNWNAVSFAIVPTPAALPAGLGLMSLMMLRRRR